MTPIQIMTNLSAMLSPGLLSILRHLTEAGIGVYKDTRVFIVPDLKLDWRLHVQHRPHGFSH